MRMNDMNAYLEKHGLQVRRTYIGGSDYEFKIRWFNHYRTYIFTYPVNNRRKAYLTQEAFLDNVLRDFGVVPLGGYRKIPEVRGVYNRERKITKIDNVIFNDPATIVFWDDGTKTVVKVEDEAFDPEKGIAMAIVKKAMGNKGNYFNEIKKWTEPYFKEQAEMETWLENFMENLAGAALYFNSIANDNKEDKNNG